LRPREGEGRQAGRQRPRGGGRQRQEEGETGRGRQRKEDKGGMRIVKTGKRETREMVKQRSWDEHSS
jgi:hypothetical protein